ncbi:D-alanine--D-alanine ligase [Dissulfurispira thermophila]|uniref:D-alanine--D-alanine ligase n=1 Tax=Dissulfurispira thermophila TaxID=2715679 RepID=A0A7G1GZP8_9BACT|nr:D-alanine--D-alanine ligase [Dissulfurispira thermophila]BCB95864.1 D-alanine--D-alanine ligase [Dissulfurispira thermophila]
MVTNKRIGVLAGGTSAEREISLKSGNAIYKALLNLGYDVVFVDVSNNICEDLKKKNVEIAFLALHGGHGENGAIQGLLEVMGISYTGSGVLSSAIAMDKEASKKVFLYHDIPVAPFVVINREQLGERINAQLITAIVDFPLPWVVKPVAEGSSIGVNIVKECEDIDDAVHSAFLYGSKIIVEKYISGREIQIGVLGQRVLGGVEVRPSTEFYSYEAKYTPGLTEYILPPEIDGYAYETLKNMALKAHNALGCRGATRVDFILDESNEPYILEVNTIPGMTETSLLPKIAKLSGLDFPDLIEEIIRQALIDKD